MEITELRRRGNRVWQGYIRREDIAGLGVRPEAFNPDTDPVSTPIGEVPDPGRGVTVWSPLPGKTIIEARRENSGHIRDSVIM